MKKFVLFLTCIMLLVSTSTIVSADHFIDGHSETPFDDFDITMELPTAWDYSALDESTVAIFPKHDKETIMILHFAEYGSDDLHSALEETFLRTAVEKSLEGITGESQDGTAEITELTDGRSSAMATSFDIDNISLCLSIHEGDYIVILSYTSPIDAFEDAYVEDIDSILTSIKETSKDGEAS